MSIAETGFAILGIGCYIVYQRWWRIFKML